MIIHVTQNDIDEGTRGSCINCPIAIAACRAFKSPVDVNAVNILRYNNKSMSFYSLPEEAQKFISAFDTNFHVKPISFKVKLTSRIRETNE